MTEDHARMTVSKETEINVLHTLFVHLNHMSFILAGTSSRQCSPFNIPIIVILLNHSWIHKPYFAGSKSDVRVTPPGTPRFSHSHSDFTTDTSAERNYYVVKSRLSGEQGIFEFPISSPELEIKIVESSNQLFEELFESLCDSTFAPFHGEEAFQRGLAKVIVRGRSTKFWI